MAKWPKLLAGTGLVTANPTELQFKNGTKVRVHLRSAVESIRNGSPKVERTNVLIETLNDSPLDLGIQAVRITPDEGEAVTVSYKQFTNLFS